MIICPDIIQGSLEWFTLKAGIPSAGSFDKIITTKGEPSKQRQKYLYQLAGETITGQKESTYQNQNMINGTERESLSRMVFEMMHEVERQEVGFVFKDERKDRGVSPDGLVVGKREGLEMKNPLMSTHIDYLLRKKLPTDYFCQVQGGLYVTGYEAWWFTSMYFGLPPFILRVERDEKFIEILSREMDAFCQELDETVKKLRAMQ